VNEFFSQLKPAYVFHLAARVGGIHANATYPAQFIYDNTIMQSNVLQAAHKNGVKKLLFPGSACAYPKIIDRRIHENDFLSGNIEQTNIAYAAAKINGIIMCQSFAKEYGLAVVLPMITNLYGVGDHFSTQASHVIPALMQRLHDAKINNAPDVVLWGSGTPLREFMYVDDAASALIYLMKNYESSDIINVNTQEEISIFSLAQLIAEIIGYDGLIRLDKTKTDGVLRKCLDNTRLLSLGWKSTVTLREGLKLMYAFHFAGEKV
jgi:GDP-L-fucose synthase